MKTLIAALTFVLATFSQSAFALYYVCKQNNQPVNCNLISASTDIEVTNNPLSANQMGYESGSLDFSVSDKAVFISIRSDKMQNIIINGKPLPVPAFLMDCYVKSASSLYQTAHLLASSNIPTVVSNGYSGVTTVRLKINKVPPISECTTLAYTKSWH